MTMTAIKATLRWCLDITLSIPKDQHSLLAVVQEKHWIGIEWDLAGCASMSLFCCCIIKIVASGKWRLMDIVIVVMGSFSLTSIGSPRE